MAYRVGMDDRAVPNPAYRAVPPLERLTADEWSGPASPDMYGRLLRDPASFAWLCAPEVFPSRYPDLWRRVADHV